MKKNKIDNLEEEQDDRSYGINLKRFVRHEKVFPWRFIGKVIIGIILMALAYYMTKQIVSKESRSNKEIENRVDVDIQSLN